MEVKNRDKKKKKSPSLKPNDDTGERCYDCECKENYRGEIEGLRPHTSRVRIYGRVGFTQDERYVVDCAAKIDETPMQPINLSPIEHNAEISPIFLAFNDQSSFPGNIKTVGCASGCRSNYRPYQRDFNVQTNLRDDITECYPVGTNRVWFGKESQGTQVNFNVLLPNDNNVKFCQKKELNLQCDYNLLDPSIQNEITKETDECQSPIVIISVYPNGESPERIKTITCYKGGNIRSTVTSPSKSPRSSPGRTRASSPQKEKEIQLSKPVYRNRSLSPTSKNIYRSKEDIYKNQEHSKGLRMTKRQISPNYQSIPTKQNTKKADKKSIFINKQNGNCKEATNQRTHLESNRNLDRSIEKKTEQMLIKQALVNDFTKRLTKDMDKRSDYNLNTLKNGVSKETLNTNKENDYYNVMFQQGKPTTGLSIRKNKNLSPRRNNDQANGMRSPSPLVFERESNEKGRRIVNKTQANAGIAEQNFSILNIRDSLECFHRRDTEQKISGTNSYLKYKRSNVDSIENQFSAPVKHYKGDDCNLPDPFERDKQIRELLGIKKRTVTISETHKYQHEESPN